MREVVFRERQEKVAQLDAMMRMIARVFHLDADRAFGDLLSTYARETFWETYDPERLRERMEALAAARRKIRQKRTEDLRLLGRLERLGEFYDQKLGPDLKRPKAGFPRKDVP